MSMENQRLQIEIERLQTERKESEARISAEMQRLQTENDMAKAKIAEILAKMDSMGSNA
jgi:seryl-tRNA synthetase